jgi:hypothetical protein
MNQEIVALLKAALECTIYLSPRDLGLTFQELAEVAKRAGYLDGEINDALRYAGDAVWGKPRVMPAEHDLIHLVFFFPEDPELKDYKALDCVFEELNFLMRSEGEARAQMSRSVLVERGVAKGISQQNMEVAIAWLVLTKKLNEKDDIVRFAQRGAQVQQLPSVTRGGHRHVDKKPLRAQALPFVKDVIARRTDGRQAHAEPLDAFADELAKLGFSKFRLWWVQTVSELKVTDPSTTPVATAVLAAALVEGVLTFIVKHARINGQFQSSDYDREPRTWKIEDLVRSAASGGPAAILDVQTKVRAETLIRTRQRIHAGRMLSDFPGGPPDLRPDEARDAKSAAEQVVRAVLDWLQTNPPAQGSQ